MQSLASSPHLKPSLDLSIALNQPNATNDSCQKVQPIPIQPNLIHGLTQRMSISVTVCHRQCKSSIHIAHHVLIFLIFLSLVLLL